MMGAEVIAAARIPLMDRIPIQWQDDELLGYLNQGRAELYAARPDIYEYSGPVVLAQGTDQILPFNSRKLLRVLGNISHPEQRDILEANEQMLGRVRPRWRNEPPNDEIQHVIFDETAPTRFQVYPPAKAGVVIGMSLASPPTVLLQGDLAGTELIEAELAYSLIDYVMWRAYLKENDSSPVPQAVMQAHQQAWQSLLSGDLATSMRVSPNHTAPGPVVNGPGS